MALEPVSLFFFFLLATLLSFARTYQNVSLGSSLTAQSNTNSFWSSPYGEFAFGFQQISGSDGFLLAIWFDKIPEKTIVWSANEGDLLSSGSEVELTTDGQLVLKAATGQQMWKANVNYTGVITYAAMLDTGNFVLVNSNSVYSWESFKQPTDTILPTQTFGGGGSSTTLFARYSETNYSRGRYTFELKEGNLKLYARYSPLDFIYYPYWKSDTEGNANQLVFNQSGSIYLTEKNGGSVIQMLSSNEASPQDFYQRAIFEYEGVFRHYVYPKSNASIERWRRGWTSLTNLPENICLMKTGDNGDDRGLGPCGFNSYCQLDQRPTCQCPEGYSFVDPDDVSMGCKQDFVSQSCNEASPESNLFYFQEMRNGDWAFSKYEHLQQVTEDYCRQECLGDCFCAAATYVNGSCTKKKSPLSNGRIDPSIGGKTLVKTRKSNTSISENGDGDSGKKDESALILIGSILLSSSVFLNFLLMVATVVVFRICHRKRKVLQPCDDLRFPIRNLQCFTYEEIKEMTNEFKEELGCSSDFAKVYKGVLKFGNGSCVAVKRFNRMITESEAEFKAEVSAIGRTNHRNLVQLFGFCNEGQYQILVYEFMSMGSLVNFLSKDSRINWYTRIQIASETASGLLYLHEECSTQIIHCDIKPQNILLDDNFTAKISDFGLAKHLKTGQNLTITAIRGSKGYIAPEWFKKMPITAKVDVYSFGILLLELICNRKSLELKAEDDFQMVLADWAYDCFMDKKLHVLVEEDNEAMDDWKNVEKYVKIALWCIQQDPSMRPSMKKVTQMLEGTVKVSIPPDPYSFISSI
ncbi:hypothetical protein FNV43_RR15071 [Rhamnella rubrinervis]|uniref:Receptor-like serine/threonine-protein kinase n=1 Tax=Rhamnella rubrinervis TaxID=2594499 RepID=A0A8K0GY91_9ROSA|nr:hypothetical protein FNV43_RR15071 [Rhamnella rubrinervis]